MPSGFSLAIVGRPLYSSADQGLTQEEVQNADIKRSCRRPEPRSLRDGHYGAPAAHADRVADEIAKIESGIDFADKTIAYFEDLIAKVKKGNEIPIDSGHVRAHSDGSEPVKSMSGRFSVDESASEPWIGVILTDGRETRAVCWTYRKQGK